MYGNPILLASESPQRASLLKTLQIPFIKIVPAIDETIYDDLPLEERVIALATAKAQQGKARWDAQNCDMRAANRQQSIRFVLGSDTLVAIFTKGSWQILGKPRDKSDAYRMLSLEQGTLQYVYSALCLLDMERTNAILPCQLLRYSFAQCRRQISSGISDLKNGMEPQARIEFRA